MLLHKKNCIFGLFSFFNHDKRFNLIFNVFLLLLWPMSGIVEDEYVYSRKYREN